MRKPCLLRIVFLFLIIITVLSSCCWSIGGGEKVEEKIVPVQGPPGPQGPQGPQGPPGETVPTPY
jgi:hypothetical protein